MENIGDARTGPETRTTPPTSAVPPLLDITHRRNRLAGLWAAELLGLIGYAAQDYARSVMHPGHSQEQPHGDDQDKVVGKLAEDLAGQVSESEIRQKMTYFLQEAWRQAKGGKNN
ncbi:ATPase inhibitor subunit zeta [Telmatospirillum sp.]|uniref:ATPase inhibitor subunit zeta n=1 Tax=Telmatospirillum sp. TaxID=2079197 RepID=UPI0028523BD0|nr:ATPase inhibitor subunit zeta [Telmatospirillum sp.]MDR3436964.1 ATPase inhibitor subunit zeta [Telmatospirillum sp.]